MRQASRTLTGLIIDFKRDHDIRYGKHEQGVPAVTVDLRGFNGTRTYAKADKLLDLADELIQAARWLNDQREAAANVDNSGEQHLQEDG